MAFLAAAVSLAAAACGDDDDSENGRTGGAGGKGGSGGSTSSGGEGGDTTGSGGTTDNTGGTGEGGGAGGSEAGGAGGEGAVDDCNPSGEGGGGGDNECSVNADFCAVGSVPGTASTEYEPDLSWYGALEEGNPADYLWIDLVDGKGVFEDGITTLDAYTLTGDDLDKDDCGLCIYITDQYDTGDETWLDTYLITGGTVTLTSVEGNITGKLEDATFVKVDSVTGVPTSDGCTSEIDQISFNAEIPE